MLFSSGGGGGGGGAQLTKANKKIDDLQHKVMQKTEELMEMHKRQTESAEKIAGLTAQLRSKEDECTKKDSRWVYLLSQQAGGRGRKREIKVKVNWLETLSDKLLVCTCT